ncbi:MAG: hypothetical protein ABSA30_10955, partial [Candidatus Aminicenantales bacterium]
MTAEVIRLFGFLVVWLALSTGVLWGQPLAQPLPESDGPAIRLLSWTIETPPRPQPPNAGDPKPTPATGKVEPDPGKAGGERPAAVVRFGQSPESLAPVPEPQNLGPTETEVTSFKGVTPGASTPAEVEKAWGQPKQSRKQDNQIVQLYAVKPFAHVEVSYRAEKVTSVVIRLEQPLAADSLAEQLELGKVQPVMVSNDLGEILGQAYPERGVLFTFEPVGQPGKTFKKVTGIVLEPITADPFVLRSETNLDIRPEFSLHDAGEALKLDPNHARAHWLESRASSLLGDCEKALQAARSAAQLEPGDCRYLLTHAQALAQAGRVRDAIAEAEKALRASQQRPHVRARALCLLGDLKASASPPDFKQAMQFHTQALQAAEPLVANQHPAIRIAAKEVLVDACLGMAHDLAWGQRQEKPAEEQLDRAAALADDLVKNEGNSPLCRFHVASRALAADVGLRGKLDPSAWVKLAIRSGEALIEGTPDHIRKSQVQWELAMALYDTLQVYQMRSDQPAALRFGELAISCLEKSGRQNQSATATYISGRLYFRVGAIHAIRNGDHKAALVWFEK